MRVETDNGTIARVQFEYRRWGEMRCTGDRLAHRKQEAEPLVTRCRLLLGDQQDAEVLASADAVCHAVDHFDYGRGRRLALHRALHALWPSAHDLAQAKLPALDAEAQRAHDFNRAAVWTAYFASTRDLQVPRGELRRTLALLQAAQQLYRDAAQLRGAMTEDGRAASNAAARIEQVAHDLRDLRAQGLL
jgi:hypothetical protein